MTTTYAIYVNVERGKYDGYQPGDRLVRTWAGLVEPADEHTIDGRVEATAHTIYVKHQRDDRPDGQLGPSLSVGDVIRLGDGAGRVYLAVESFGFRLVPPPDASQVEYDRPWREVVREVSR